MIAISNSDLDLSFDVIVIGGGLTGCVIARRLAEELNFKVLIVEKRDHIGGNLYDYIDENGILVQKYGPHVIHTDNEEVYKFLIKYSEWERYGLDVMVNMCGKNTPSPFNFKTIDDYFNEEESIFLKNEIRKEYGTNAQATIVELLNSKIPIIKKYANFLFKHDYSLYTAKQWGISPSDIDISVLNRVPVRFSYEKGYFSDKYQMLPSGGFSKFIENILNHDNIKVELSSNFTENLSIDISNGIILYKDEKLTMPIIYTGELDQLLCYRHGRLPYRSLMFKNITLNKDVHQDVPIIAYPEDKEITRIVEYKQLPVQKIKGVTTLVEEYPVNYEGGNEPFYPILTKDSVTQYDRYKKEIETISNLYVCGRLGDFKYYNMDQAIERAFDIFEEVKISARGKATTQKF